MTTSQNPISRQYRKNDLVLSPQGEGVVTSVADEVVEVFAFSAGIRTIDDLFDAAELTLVAAAPDPLQTPSTVRVGSLTADRLGWNADRMYHVQRAVYGVKDRSTSRRGRTVGTVHEVARGFQATPKGQKYALPVEATLGDAIESLRKKQS